MTKCDKKFKKAVEQYGTKEVVLGVKIEKEHGGTFCDALDVTIDHLNEFPNYNSQLVKFEKRLKRGLYLK